jgi:hypothetical protein
MNTTAQIRPPRMPRGRKQPTDPCRSARATAAERPTFGAMLVELVPLIGFVPAYGPPAIFVLGPWLFLGLMLAGPFAFLVTLVVAMVVAATVLAALTAAVLAILAAPYLLVRHLRRQWARHASISAPAARAVTIESPRVAA